MPGSSSRPPDLSLVADRRARETGHRSTPTLTDKRPLGRSGEGRGAASAADGEATTRAPGAGLTKRERRVKNLLLKELKTLSDGKALSYNEIQKLDKTLDVAFIDEQLKAMRKQLRWLPKILLGGVVMGSIFFLIIVSDGLAGGSVDWGSAVMSLLSFLSAFAAPYFQSKALRRKIFIYEALRELSDADEESVQLSEAVRQADLLIDRIVEQEMEAPRLQMRPPPRTPASA